MLYHKQPEGCATGGITKTKVHRRRRTYMEGNGAIANRLRHVALDRVQLDLLLFIGSKSNQVPFDSVHIVRSISQRNSRPLLSSLGLAATISSSSWGRWDSQALARLHRVVGAFPQVVGRQKKQEQQLKLDIRRASCTWYTRNCRRGRRSPGARRCLGMDPRGTGGWLGR